MNPFPPPRAYVDWEVPLRPDGSKLTRTLDEADYIRYVSWLADYLYDIELPVPECQKGLAGFPCFIPDEFDPFAFEDLENRIQEGYDYPTYLKLMTEQWKAYFKELQEQFPDSEESEEESNKCYFFDICVATEEPFNRVMCEIDERKAKGVPQDIEHADIPYRAVFAKTLKEMPTHEERVSALRSFYDRWSQAIDEVYSK